MNRKLIFAVAAVAAMTLSAASVFAADPTLHEVYQAVEGGRLQQAQAMMDQVLRDHPNSAKAHFVEAELLAKQGRLDMARAELGTAERLAPGLPFAKTDAVAALKRQVDAPAARALPTQSAHALPAAAAAEFPWGWLAVGLGLLAAAIFFFRSLNRSRVYPAGAAGQLPAAGGFGNGAYPQAAGPAGYGPGAPPVAGGGMGSGILGGLATGAAVGAGIVAGEALMHKVFDSGNAHAAEPSRLQPVEPPQTAAADYNMGGSDFGVSDAGSWDDAGGGGDDWS